MSQSKSHSTSALACLGATTFGAFSVVRSEHLLPQLAFALMSAVAFVGYMFLRPGGPDMMKDVRQNQYDASRLARNSMDLFTVVATSVAGNDRSKWDEIMEDVGRFTADYPEDVRKDLNEAGKVITACNWVVESFEYQWGVQKWWNAEKDADMLNQASACLKNMQHTLKVRGNVSFILLAARTNGNRLNRERTAA